MKKIIITFILVINYFFVTSAFAAISLDRTRVIFDGSKKSISLNIGNKNKQLPYLAQGWIENEKGEKIKSPFVVLPPIQRLEPSQSSQIRIEALPAIKNLPQDRESIFYFNLREIPPKSDKPNVLQLALQSKIKLFYRPASLVDDNPNAVPWQEKLQLIKKGNDVIAKNPTPYYVTIVSAASSDAQINKNEIKPVMIAPFGEEKLGVSPAKLGNNPILAYINDYGGRPKLYFKCEANHCNTIPGKN